jgi:hypothetical protein
MSRWRLVLIVAVALVAGGVATGVALEAKLLAPARAPFYFPWRMLADETATMNDCVECHEPEKFHTCTTCHDEHGSAEMAKVPFGQLVLLAGDLPVPGYIAVNDILPYRELTSTHVALLDLLAQKDVKDFLSVTLASSDGGFVTIEQPNLTPEALLLPYTDGMRFADESLHVSTWLKGIDRIIVVGRERPLMVDGQPTSIGRLLLRPTRFVTVEQTETMFKSATDGKVRKAKTAFRIEGAPIEDMVADPGFERLRVRDVAGQERTLSADEADGAVLAQMGKEVVLVLPGRGRSQWVSGVVEITTE